MEQLLSPLPPEAPFSEHRALENCLKGPPLEGKRRSNRRMALGSFGDKGKVLREEEGARAEEERRELEEIIFQQPPAQDARRQRHRPHRPGPDQAAFGCAISAEASAGASATRAPLWPTPPPSSTRSSPPSTRSAALPSPPPAVLPAAVLRPFLDVVRSEDAGATVTSASLAALHEVMSLKAGAEPAVEEAVLMRMLQALLACLRRARGGKGDAAHLAGSGKVYDVTAYVEEHPGGDAILNNAGDDSTEGFFGFVT
nr:uncharacterized protein LOC117844198 [Setaria viridis]